jgi:hypothetical protein
MGVVRTDQLESKGNGFFGVPETTLRSIISDIERLESVNR